MGKNKLSKFADMATYRHVFQVSSHALRTGTTFELRGNWSSTFFKNENPIVLELGCGKGEYTVGLAERYPEKNFIGVDIKGARMWTGAKLSLEKGLKNVAFLRTDIEMINHFFAPEEVSEIWLTFPDPQMKKVTKRLTATNFIQTYLRFLKENAVIHLKTDSNFLYTYTIEMVKVNNLPVIYSSENIYASELIDPILGIKTFYEQQWLERGISIKYIRWIPQHREQFIEPDVDIEKDSYRSFARNRKTF